MKTVIDLKTVRKYFLFCLVHSQDILSLFLSIFMLIPNTTTKYKEKKILSLLCALYFHFHLKIETILLCPQDVFLFFIFRLGKRCLEMSMTSSKLRDECIEYKSRFLHNLTLALLRPSYFGATLSCLSKLSCQDSRLYAKCHIDISSSFVIP